MVEADPNAVGELRRNIAIDRAMELAAIVAPRTIDPLDVEALLYDAKAIERFLADGALPGDDDEPAEDPINNRYDP